MPGPYDNHHNDFVNYEAGLNGGAPIGTPTTSYYEGQAAREAKRTADFMGSSQGGRPLTPKEVRQILMFSSVPLAALIIIVTALALSDKIKTTRHESEKVAAVKKHAERETRQENAFKQYIARMSPTPLEKVEADLLVQPNREELLNLINNQQAPTLSFRNYATPYQLNQSSKGMRIIVDFDDRSLSYGGIIKPLTGTPGCMNFNLTVHNRYGAGYEIIKQDRCLQNGQWVPANKR